MDKIINILLKNIYLRNLIFMIAGVLMGSTLQPVPNWITHVFNTSHIVKFIILFLTSVAVFYPMDKNKVMISFVSSIITLLIFNIISSKQMENFMGKILKIKNH